MFEYIWLLLPLGLLIGWLAAKRDNVKKQKMLRYLNLRYFIEESQEVDDQLLTLPPDYDADNLNFSLMLGDVFRKRGEIDKAINLHEYLIKEAPTKALTEKVYLSLAEDYLAAGMLDRGESTLRLLLESENYKKVALLKLSKVYKQQREWLQSIAMLEQVTPLTEDLLAEMAHLYCELAEEELLLQDPPNLDRLTLWLDKALLADNDCARANLIRAYALYYYENFEASLESLMLIEGQRTELLPVITPMVYELSSRNKRPEYFYEWLERAIIVNDHIVLKAWKTHYLILNESFEAGVEYLQSVLKKESNLYGLMLLNKLQKYQQERTDAILVEKTFREMLDQYAQFRCESCGYTTKAMQWSCPSCFEWNRSIPVTDIVALKVKH
ncbi:hypothetical protein MMG00_05785 [Ignatzschineria rhizosphaerae]|uniref:LapB rubredoxin metal binding domain-containing protein n=1 Tax=Ignatzschineria rhizosphaerae TaxID=2923279 RepID=A0ABY3X6H5_9GAMM|nr:hypothetical protein [Ignatzschineria rhizosphaerae]UNM97356.1 hypothetical protein MMG00_05785 [Ignatzschineria rhizosphaerae]